MSVCECECVSVCGCVVAWLCVSDMTRLQVCGEWCE